MLATTPISEIMTTDPVTVQPTDNLDLVHKLFEKYGFHHLPVVEAGKIVGLVSHSDYLRIIRGFAQPASGQRTNVQLLNSMLAADVMSKNLLCLRATDTLAEALRVFKANRFHAIPVTDAHDKLLGIITTFDMLLALEVLLAQV